MCHVFSGQVFSDQFPLSSGRHNISKTSQYPFLSIRTAVQTFISLLEMQHTGERTSQQYCRIPFPNLLSSLLSAFTILLSSYMARFMAGSSCCPILFLSFLPGRESNSDSVVMCQILARNISFSGTA